MKNTEKEQIIKEFQEVFDKNKYPFITADDIEIRLFITALWAARKTTNGNTAKALEKINEHRKEMSKIPEETLASRKWVEEQIDKLMYPID